MDDSPPPLAAVPPVEDTPPTPPAPALVGNGAAANTAPRRISRVPVVAGPASPVPAAEAAPSPAAAAQAAQAAQAAEERHVQRASLGDQVACIDRARGALASGDPAEALRVVAEYDARFPGGMLSQEATVLRIEALVKEGNRPAAVAVGRSFLATHPTSPHAAKVNQLIDGADNP